jgi:hypothetical protein
MRRLFALIVLLVPLLASCDSFTEPDNSHIGTFGLQTVNGNALPFLAAEAGDDKLEITEGFITTSEDGAFKNGFTFRETRGGEVTTIPQEMTGTFNRSSNEITFTDARGGSFMGSLEGSTVTIVGQGATFVFQK